jgi:hypothetical protein
MKAITIDVADHMAIEFGASNDNLACAGEWDDYRDR